MHSSGMCTARLLTISQHALAGVCVYPIMHWVGCIPSCTGQGVWVLPKGPEADTPHPCGQTDTCENIAFANFVCGR